MVTGKEFAQGVDAIAQDLYLLNKVQELENIAGFRLTYLQRLQIARFQQLEANDSLPYYLRELKSHHPKRFNQVCDGILGNVQRALTGVYYHRSNLARTEALLYAAANDEEFLQQLNASTVAIGNTAIIDFECHALIFSARRCLDYLARVVGACFRIDISSFRNLSSIRHSHPKLVADAVLNVYSENLPNLGKLVSSSLEKSFRDVLAHYRFVGAGTLNINRNWNGLFGGPEKLNEDFKSNQRQTLIQPVDQLCSTVQQTVNNLLIALLRDTPGSE